MAFITFGTGRVDLRGQAGVAVVEADHLEAALRQALAELQVPVDQLHPEPHHQQDRRDRPGRRSSRRPARLARRSRALPSPAR